MTVWAFLDESGDPDIDVTVGASTHFAVSAVIVPDSELVATRGRVEDARHEHFQTGQIKSKSVGGNLQRRLRVLASLVNTGIRFIGLVVDKRRLVPGSGLRFRPSFMKFIDRFVYDRLFKAYPVLRVRADQHGRPQFMESFERYLSRRAAQTDLFERPPQIEFTTARDEVLIQAADFFAGSLRIAHGDDLDDAQARELLGSVSRVSLGIQTWPATTRSDAALARAEEPESVDEDVRLAAERSAHAFLADAQDKDDDATRMQVEVLQELLYASKAEESPYLSADALADRLRELGYVDCSRDTIRRSVIAPMRDREVLIVSSAKGYGLPSKLAEVETHIHRMEDEVRPILRRVKVMDELLRRASVGKVDVVGADRLAYVRALLEAHHTHDARDRIAPEVVSS